jgi:hypothetical protein
MAVPAAADRSKLLQELDLRHDALLRELDELNQRVEQALGELRPPVTDGNAPPRSIRISRQGAKAEEGEED